MRLAGVEAIVAEGFERIHRTNLVGMGVLPLEFKPGVNRMTLGIDGTETFDVIGERKPRADLTLVIHRKNGERVEVPVTCRLDTAEEVSIYEAGGVLQRFAQDFLESSKRLPEHRQTDGTLRCVPSPNHADHIAMTHAPQIKIPATYMRGGTSKGVFFRLQDLPEAAQVPGAARDALLLRVIGSPDPYGKQIDGMGGATSSTSKTVIVAKSSKPDHDVDYLFGQVAIDKAFVDWSGNCGNLSAAVGPFAISERPGRCRAACRDNGVAIVRIWQANIGKTIIAHVPITERRGAGNRRLRTRRRDLPGRRSSARIHGPGRRGRRRGRRDVPDRQSGRRPRGAGRRHAEGDDDQRRHPDHLRERGGDRLHGHRTAGRDQQRSEGAGDVRDDPRARRGAHGPDQARRRDRERGSTRRRSRSSRKPADYVASSGKPVAAGDVDLLVRAMSMGKLHHAMMGTAAVAIGTAAAIPGTLVNLAAGGGERDAVRFGHPSGTLRVGARGERRSTANGPSPRPS